MKSEIIRRLLDNNQQRDWFAMQENFKATQDGSIGDEPVYKFFDTLSDDLEVNSKTISIAVQPFRSHIPFHIHNYVEMIIPIQGTCTLETRSGLVEIEQDNIVLIGKNTPHRVHNISEETLVVNIALKTSAFSFNDLNFMLHTSGMQGVSHLLFTILNEEDGEGQYSLFDIQHQTKIVELVADIIDEYYSDAIQSTQIVHFNILTLFSRLIRQTYDMNKQVKNVKEHENSLMLLLLYIERQYVTITLDEMAAQFGFNPNYLSTYLKKRTGMSFIKLVHLQRINVAAEYLRHTNVAIDKISLKVGYENPSYFYKIFKKTLGMSPTEYRKKNR